MCWVSYNPPLPSQGSEWHAHASLIDHIWFFGVFFFDPGHSLRNFFYIPLLFHSKARRREKIILEVMYW